MYKITKRIIDLFVAAIALMLLSPGLIPSILILLRTGEHEVFYFQKRIGYKNKLFDIWKFATMMKNSPNIGTGEITLRNDPRVTKFGKILRMTKVNELPQIINVFKGDMSIVGPRPDIAGYYDLLEGEDRKILELKPGLTSLASLKYYNEDALLDNQDFPLEYNDKILFPDKLRMNLEYYHHQSFHVDLKIILATFKLICNRSK